MALQVCSWSYRFVHGRTGVFMALQVCLWSCRYVCGLAGLFIVLQVCSWSYRSVQTAAVSCHCDIVVVAMTGCICRSVLKGWKKNAEKY